MNAPKGLEFIEEFSPLIDDNKEEINKSVEYSDEMRFAFVKDRFIGTPLTCNPN